MDAEIELMGTKHVEVPYFCSQMNEPNASVLIVGERHGGEGVSETIKYMGFHNVTTTDIVSIAENSWLDKNRGDWKHIESDFTEFDENNKYDYIVAVSVFEHFGFWFSGNRMANGIIESDGCKWNHDIRGITKACRLLRDQHSKLIITLPAGPYMNYEKSGEPFLRSYDYLRQNIVKNAILQEGCVLHDEKFYFSEDVSNWEVVGAGINDPLNYSKFNPFTPNVIWAFTIKKL